VIQNDERALDQVQVHDSSLNMSQSVPTSFDIQVELKNKKETSSFTIENVGVDQLLVGDKSINAKTLLNNHAVISSGVMPEGLSLNRISDSRLNLQSIESVTFKIVSKSQDRFWDVINTSVECIKAKVDRQSLNNEQPLFQNNEISTYCYRQCLLDPLLFNVVNKQIVSVISDPQVS
jgi:hypothetical protein